MCGVYACVCITSSLSIHMPMDTDCFHTLVIVNNAAMNIQMNISFEISVFGFFSYNIYPGVSWLFDQSSTLLPNLTLITSLMSLSPIQSHGGRGRFRASMYNSRGLIVQFVAFMFTEV